MTAHGHAGRRRDVHLGSTRRCSFARNAGQRGFVTNRYCHPGFGTASHKCTKGDKNKNNSFDSHGNIILHEAIFFNSDAETCPSKAKGYIPPGIRYLPIRIPRKRPPEPHAPALPGIPRFYIPHGLSIAGCPAVRVIKMPCSAEFSRFQLFGKQIAL